MEEGKAFIKLEEESERTVHILGIDLVIDPVLVARFQGAVKELHPRIRTTAAPHTMNGLEAVVVLSRLTPASQKLYPGSRRREGAYVI